MFEAEIPVAFEAPKATGRSFLQFALVGFYVGVVPVALGLLWFPVMAKMGRRGMNFILALTIGLLAFLVADMWEEAREVGLSVAGSLDAPVLIPILAVLTTALLVTVGNWLKQREAGEESSALRVSYQIATGIGLHNLGEGLAIGSAFALGETALGVFLIVGFTLHNVTEGVGIAAPHHPRSPGAAALSAADSGGGWSGRHRHLDRRVHLFGLLDNDLPGNWNRRDSAGHLGSRPPHPALANPQQRAALHLEHVRRNCGRGVDHVRHRPAGRLIDSSRHTYVRMTCT